MSKLQRDHFHNAVDILELPPAVRSAKRDGRIFRGSQLEIGGHIYRVLRIIPGSYRLTIEYLGPMIVEAPKDEPPTAKCCAPDGGKCA